MKGLSFSFAQLTMTCAALLLCCCGESQRGHATPQAAKELEDMRTVDIPSLAQQDIVEPELIDMFHNTIDRFSATMDTQYTAPFSGFGILHLACLFKKPELVRCLLLDGADPNKHTPQDDSPLLLAVGTFLFPDTPTQTLITLVDTLLEGGADFAQSGHYEGDFLTQAASVCENEDVILHLLDKGAAPDADTALRPALHGWLRALRALLRDDASLTPILQAAAIGSCRFKGSHTECMTLLLERGANVNDASEGEPPIFSLARELATMPSTDPLLTQGLDAFVLLLRHGADPYLRVEDDEEYPGFCAYDLLALQPLLLEQLGNRGIRLEKPEISFSAGSALLPELCRAAIDPPSAEALDPHYDRIATALAPSPDMRQRELYPQALEAALTLMARVDPARTVASIAAMPLWQGEWNDEDAQAILAPTLAVLRETDSLILPKDFLCRQAERLIGAEQTEAAAALVELLARCPDAEQEIARYCADARLPLQAGAYAARLYLDNLPDARNNGVAAWLLEQRRQADTPFLRDAVLLTSLEKLWFGEMPPAEQQQMLTLMRRIGAPAAAAAYEHIIRNLDNPEQLDALMEQGDGWKYELEAATARFFLERRADFTPPSP